jgi:hypothetical protein
MAETNQRPENTKTTPTMGKDSRKGQSREPIHMHHKGGEGHHHHHVLYEGPNSHHHHTAQSIQDKKTDIDKQLAQISAEKEELDKRITKAIEEAELRLKKNAELFEKLKHRDDQINTLAAEAKEYATMGKSFLSEMESPK